MDDIAPRGRRPGSTLICILTGRRQINVTTCTHWQGQSSRLWQRRVLAIHPHACHCQPQAAALICEHFYLTLSLRSRQGRSQPSKGHVSSTSCRSRKSDSGSACTRVQLTGGLWYVHLPACFTVDHASSCTAEGAAVAEDPALKHDALRKLVSAASAKLMAVRLNAGTP